MQDLTPRFIADRMVGKLARWLRILGYDTLYPEAGDDSHLLAIARREGRILLTRDTHLLGRKDIQVLFIESDHLAEQVKQVASSLKLQIGPARQRSVAGGGRCTACNTPLEEVGRTESKGFVPEFIYFRHRIFGRCPRCGKFYWKGTHWRGIEEKIVGRR